MVIRGLAQDRWPLVGRDLELAAFRDALMNGRMRGFAVCGPSGVGKSRLAEECWEWAQRDGAAGGRAVAIPATGTVPLGAIAHLIPENVDHSNPVALFSSTIKALTARGSRPQLLFIDDLHWLDATSVMLLRQLMDADAIRLIATVRSDDPLSIAVSRLLVGDDLARVDLAELRLDEVQDLLHQVLGGPLAQNSLQELYEASGGNILYLRELTEGALSVGALTSNGELWELADRALAGTPRLTELIGARLAAAGPDGRPAVELLALCGSLPLADVEHVAPTEALLELERVGLICAVTDGRRTYLYLAHPMYAEVARSRIPALRQRVLLLGQVERIEALGMRRREDALHVASWRLATTGAADPQLLAEAALLARHAHDHEQVVALLGALPAHRRTVETQLLYGATLHDLCRYDAAEAAYTDADALAISKQDAIAVACARSLNRCWGNCQIDEALAIVDAARAQADTSGLTYLQHIDGHLLVCAGEPVPGLGMLETLHPDNAEGLDINVWAAAAVMKISALAIVGRTAEAVRWGKRAYATHKRAQEQAVHIPPASMQLHAITFALSEAGRLAGARSIIYSFQDVMIPSVSTWAAFFKGRIEWLSGHPAEARRWYAECVTLGRASGHRMAMHVALAGLGASAALLGDTESAQAALKESQKIQPIGILRGEERLCEAWLHASTGRLSQARDVLIDAADDACKYGHLTSEALLLTDIARLGGAEYAAPRLAELAGQIDGAFSPARANFAAALAQGAPEPLLAAADEFSAIGADLLEAEAAAAAAVAWRKAGRARNATAAAHRAAAAAARCPGARTPALSGIPTLTPLTPREHEIALQAAAGNLSKDIAATLCVSVRTINNHLNSVYKKLGVTSRQELSKVLAGGISTGALPDSRSD
jgi:ATP/maltotriose-dependent transcriptional regulator MalT